MSFILGEFSYFSAPEKNLLKNQMRETDFIRQNKEKWREFEQSLKEKDPDPEKLSKLFIETTDDLSYSRTYYPNRSVRVYLNTIAQKVFQDLYKTNHSRRGTFKKFWKETLPNAMWYSRKQLLWSFILFSAAIIIGMWSSQQNPDFVKITLGESYVQMTEANIESGDPMAVYQDEEPLVMFLRIMWNNIFVSFLCFILGIMAGVGTIMALLSNGIMVGSFIMFFVQRGLLKESLLAIMLHGTIELSMIVLAGCAGFTLASGIVFPSNYKRLQALTLSARRGIIIMMGVSAFLVVAAAIEGFATRYTDVPDVVRALLIVLSLVLVIGYFVVYPRMRYKRGLVPDEEEEELQEDRKYNIELGAIKSTGKIFTEIFYYFNSGFSKLSRWALGIAVAGGIGLYFIAGESLGRYVWETENLSYIPFADIIWVWNEVNNFFDYTDFPLVFPMLAVLLSAGLLQAHFLFQSKNGVALRFGKFLRRHLIKCVVAASIFLVVFFLDGLLSFIALFLIWPFIELSLCTAIEENIGLLRASLQTLKLLNGSKRKLPGLFLVLIGIPWIMCLMLSGPLWIQVFRFIAMNLPASWEISNDLPWVVYTIMTYFILFLSASMFTFGHLLFYHSLKERSLAENLKIRIQKIGLKPRAYGMEKE